MLIYLQEMVGTSIFAITGVLAVRKPNVDIFGALVLGTITAIGGGTIRDLLLNIPIFWIVDINYAGVALITAMITFFCAHHVQRHSQSLLYFDSLAGALFAIVASEKVLDLHYSATVAITMGVLSSIGGGIIRDVLSGRDSLLMSRDIYATPILLGCVLYTFLRETILPVWVTGFVTLLFICSLRFCAIHKHLQMPKVFSTK